MDAPHDREKQQSRTIAMVDSWFMPEVSLLMDRRARCIT
jgi:hypothetical protein